MKNICLIIAILLGCFLVSDAFPQPLHQAPRVDIEQMRQEVGKIPTNAENAAVRLRILTVWIQKLIGQGKLSLVRNTAPRSRMEGIGKMLRERDEKAYQEIDKAYKDLEQAVGSMRMDAEARRDFGAHTIDERIQGKSQKDLPKIEAITPMKKTVFQLSAQRDTLPFVLNCLDESHPIIVEKKAGSLSLISSPKKLELTINHLKVIPIRFRGKAPKGLTVTASGASEGDHVEIKYGYLFVRTLLAVPHQMRLMFESGLCHLEIPIDIEVTIPRGRPFFGVQDHFDRYPPGPTRKALEDMVYMQYLPSHVYRLPLAWHLIERKKGVYNWSLWDWYIRAIRLRGQSRILAGVGQVPRWLGKNSDLATNAKLLSAYKEMTTKIVRHYADLVDYWAIGNEPLAFWWPQYIKRTPEEHVKDCGPSLLVMIREASSIIRKEDPSALILCPGFVDGARKPFRNIKGGKIKTHAYAMLEWLLASGMGQYIDAINLHNYPTFKKNEGRLYSLKPEYLVNWREFDQTTDSSEVLGLLERYKLNLPIWTTEFGGFRLGANPGENEFRRQAMAILRSAAIIAHQRGEGILFFELYDYTHPNDIMDSYLMLNTDHAELPGFLAYRHIISALTGASPFSHKRFKNSMVIGSDYSGLVYKMFTRTDEDVICLWNNFRKDITVVLIFKKDISSKHFMALNFEKFRPSGEFVLINETSGQDINDKMLTLTLKPFEFIIITAITELSGFEWLRDISYKNAKKNKPSHK